MNMIYNVFELQCIKHLQMPLSFGLEHIPKPSSNRLPNIFTLVQKVKHRVYKMHAF